VIRVNDRVGDVVDAAAVADDPAHPDDAIVFVDGRHGVEAVLQPSFDPLSRSRSHSRHLAERPEPLDRRGRLAESVPGWERLRGRVAARIDCV
jgi:hypothetical protein